MTNMEIARWAFVYLVTLNIVAYVGFLCWGWWGKRRALTKAWRQYKVTDTITPVVPPFHAGGPVHNRVIGMMSLGTAITQAAQARQTSLSTGQILSSTAFAKAGRIMRRPNTAYYGGVVPGTVVGSVDPAVAPPEPLEETWSNEKVEAWRVISVTVKEGNLDGLWLGFPHPDGPTADVVTPIRHPIGVELHAECKMDRDIKHKRLLPDCHTIPGEWCDSGYGAGCGFYAYKTRQQAVKHLETEFMFRADLRHAVAYVLLSGKVIEHENGYRAEILEVVNVEPVPYRDPRDSFTSIIEVTTRAFNAFGKSYIASGGV